MNSWRQRLYKNDAQVSKSDMAYDEPMPDNVKNWITKLLLLDGIPLSYLVADERMLPMESVRFFCINPDWMSVLLDGALSMGRMTTAEAEHDAAHLPLIREEINRNLLTSRWQQMHESHRRTELPGESDSDVRTGFLMRSELVAHWDGIEVKGFDQNGSIELVRMEHLSDKILIGIFDGQVSKVEISEPMEDLHFGSRSSTHKIQIRYVDDERIGKLTDREVVIPEEENGRVDVRKLVEEIESALKSAGGESKDETSVKIGSAELALEMLSVAGHCSFRRYE